MGLSRALLARLTFNPPQSVIQHFCRQIPRLTITNTSFRRSHSHSLVAPDFVLTARDATNSGLPPGISTVRELEWMVFRHNAFYYAVAALFTLLIYEYCITFHKEVQFIWRAKSKFTLTNCLFFLNRYLPIFRAGIFLFFSFFPPSNPRTCTRFTDINSWCTMLSVATVEILMLVRTWALYSKSRKVGIILLAVWLVALGGCVVVVKSSIKPIPGVIPLDPIYINPCDRPSPYKYFITYVIVLCFELFSFIIMMVRINSLASRTPSTNVRGRVRRSTRPLIPTIQKHGLYYFTCVVCVMTLNVVASFSKSLSRVVINAGMGPIIASIACNRVIFALHGLYTEIDHGPRSAMSSFKTAKPPSGNQNHLHVADSGPSETSIKYDDEDIARTRQDLTTRDLTTRDLGVNEYRRPSLPNDLHEMEAEGYAEKGNTSSGSPKDGVLSPNSISNFPARPQLPLHGHHTSWSTTQSSKEFTSDSKSTSILHRSRSTAPTIDSQTPLHRATSSDAHLPKLNSPLPPLETGGRESSRGHRSSSSFGTVVRSLSRGGGPRSPIMRVFTRSTHAGDVTSPALNRDPGAMEAGLGTEMSSGESSTGGKRPPWWQRNVTPKRDEELETKAKDKGVVKGRPRGRERHPLDHQYEMDTILTGGSGDASGIWSPTETQIRPLEISQMMDKESQALDAPRRHSPTG